MKRSTDPAGRPKATLCSVRVSPNHREVGHCGITTEAILLDLRRPQTLRRKSEGERPCRLGVLPFRPGIARHERLRECYAGGLRRSGGRRFPPRDRKRRAKATAQAAGRRPTQRAGPGTAIKTSAPPNNSPSTHRGIAAKRSFLCRMAIDHKDSRANFLGSRAKQVDSEILICMEEAPEGPTGRNRS
jgi:hypothetical protein